MRVIFQNGSVVDLTNVNNIILDNEMERNIVALAVDIYDGEEYGEEFENWFGQLKDALSYENVCKDQIIEAYNKLMEENHGVDQHETSPSGSDGYVSGESDVASKS